ncbi:diguanylate cyclase with PAS/PAC sensor, partial [Aduncisulcus paluster]
EKFARYAKVVLSGENLLKNLAAAPDFVMRFVSPLEGNLAIVGMDYRKLPNQWGQAKKAQETGDMVIAGPLKLVQGGYGLIGRAPVFVESEKGKKFWGIISAVIDVDKLFKVVDISDNGLDIAIRGVDGLGEEGKVFLGPHNFSQPKTLCECRLHFLQEVGFL